MDSKRISVVAVGGGNVSLNCMGHSVHTGMCNELLRHGLGKFGVYDSNIGSDLKVSDRVLDTLAVVSDDRESSNLGSSAGCGRDCAEMSLFAELRECRIPCTYPQMYISGYSYLIHIAFAASIGEPPPIATIQSGSNFEHSLCASHNSLD